MISLSSMIPQSRSLLFFCVFLYLFFLSLCLSVVSFFMKLFCPCSFLLLLSLLHSLVCIFYSHFFPPHITFIFVCKKSRILFNIICLCKSIIHLSFHYLSETLFISTPFSHHLLQHVGLKAGNVLLTQGLFLLPFFNLLKAVRYQKVEP